MTQVTCNDCKHDFHFSSDRCPHCARPGLYPNVVAATGKSELDSLETRYSAAVSDSSSRGAEKTLADFERAMLNSKAIAARSAIELFRLVEKDNQLYWSYYAALDGGVFIPEGSKWDLLRTVADDLLFPNYKKQVKFAALSLDGNALWNYGPVALVFGDSMISHRASVFAENSAIFIERERKKSIEAGEVPPGYRAPWSSRGKLAVSKLAAFIHSATPTAEFSRLLLEQGGTTGEDRFIEVHVWGPCTIRTFEKVVLSRRAKIRGVQLKALREKLAKHGVQLEEK